MAKHRGARGLATRAQDEAPGQARNSARQAIQGIRVRICAECQTHYTRRDDSICYRCNEKRESDSILASNAPRSPIRFPLPAGTTLACQNRPELYFAQGKVRVEAKELCHSCPAYTWCMEWATANDEEGVWAGLTQGQRRARAAKLTQDSVELVA